jgi:predicted transcriptional regulator
MPEGHQKRSADVKQSVFFLYENRQLDTELCKHNGFHYFTITEKGKEFVRKILQRRRP